MPFDFKQDLTDFQGQEQPEAPIGGTSGFSTVNTLVGASPVKKAFDFKEDIKGFTDADRLETAPATEAAQVKQIKDRDEAIKIKEEDNRAKKATLEAAGIDPNNGNMKHNYLAPQDELTPTANIEIDYVNDSREDIANVPEGTVGGHCGVYAENVVKLPGGGNWIVGDTIGEKTASLDRYAKAGLAFKTGEDAPEAGNSVIINPGTKWGHVAVINNIDEDGNITLTESNWNWDKRVTHTRTIKADDPSIVGYIRTQ